MDLLQHSYQIRRVADQQRGAEALDEVAEDDGVGVLRQDRDEAFEFVLSKGKKYPWKVLGEALEAGDEERL